jgi:hypothetical protein
VFEKHREKKEAKEYQESLTKWQAQRDEYAELLQLAEQFDGVASDEIMLGAGEGLFYTITGASLIEERRGRGHYEGGSTGVSIPMGSIGGRSVRYRVGATRGHYVQGEPTPTAIDTGTIYVTNKRVVFQGRNQTRECDYAKLIGFEHDDAAGSTTFSVSNRQKPTTVHYGPDLSGAFDFRLDLALAHFKGTVDALVSQLKEDLAQVEAARPVPPASLPN